MPQQDALPSAGTTGDPSSLVVPLPLHLQIHAACRQYHTCLNRLITRRLPQCVPPNTDSPFLYLVGIKRFAEMYFTFEDALLSLDGRSSGNEVSHASYGLEKALQTLNVPQLSRSQRLKADISFLSQRLCIGMTPLELDIFLSPSVETEDFAAHIFQAVTDNPHLLLAYTWVLYMAPFNGGRWLRDQLMGAGEDFWTGQQERSGDGCGEDRPEHPCLAFWFFEGDRDGEDTKEEFKARHLAVCEMLTAAERVEVVREAELIFQKLALMVEELDEDCKFLHLGKDMKPKEVGDEERMVDLGIKNHIQRIWSSGSKALSKAGFGWWTGTSL